MRNYANTAGPIQDLLKVPKGKSKGAGARKLAWTDKSRQSLEGTRKVLVEGLSLLIMNPDAPFMLETDASNYAIGAVLHQFDTDGSNTGEKGRAFPVSFFSRKLSAGQLNWSPRDKECYAIVSALHKWSDWIGLNQVDVKTDHQSLQSWSRELMDKASGPSGRKGRWHELLSKFDVSVTYVPGKQKSIPDAPSRWAYPESKAFQDISKHGGHKSKHEMHDTIAEEQKLEKASIYGVKQGTASRQWWQSIGQEGEPPVLITVEQSPFLDGQ